MSIKYEDVIDNPVEVLRKIVRNLNIAKAKTVALPQNSWFDAHGKSFYLSKGPWGLAPTKLRTVKNLVDWEVIGKYGYKPVKPEWFYDPVIYEEDDWTFKI